MKGTALHPRGTKRPQVSLEGDSPGNDISPQPPSPPNAKRQRLPSVSSLVQVKTNVSSHDMEDAYPGSLSNISSHPEIFLTILSFLHARDLVVVEGVCKTWRRAGLDGQLWKSLYLTNTGLSHRASPIRPSWSQVNGNLTGDTMSANASRLYSPSPLAQASSWEIASDQPEGNQENVATSLTDSGSELQASYTDTSDNVLISQDALGGTPPIPVDSAQPVRLFAPLPARAKRTADRSTRNTTIATHAGLFSATSLDLDRDACSPPSIAAPSTPNRNAATRSNPPRSVDWKRLVRVGTNWSNGNAQLTQLRDTCGREAIEPGMPDAGADLVERSLGGVTHAVDGSSGEEDLARRRRIGPIPIVALSPGLVFVAYTESPLVHVYATSASRTGSGEDPSQARRKDPDSLAAGAGDGQESNSPVTIIPPPPGWSSPSRPNKVTAIAVDESLSSTADAVDPDGHTSLARAVVWYESGGWAVLGISSSDDNETRGKLSWRRLYVQEPPNGAFPRRNRRQAHAISVGDPFLLGRMHWPVVVGCTKGFFISVWRLRLDEKGTFRSTLLSTLHSPVSSWPATIRLEPVAPNIKRMDDDEALIHGSHEEVNNASSKERLFKVSLAYCTPLYPQSWTVAVQEIKISLPLGPVGPTPSEQGIVAVERSYHVKRSLGGYGPSWLGKMRRKLGWVGRSGAVIGVKGEQAVGIGLDEKWCVLAGEDNQIQVYAMPVDEEDKATSLETEDDVEQHTTEGSQNEITHSQTLLAHGSSVTSIAVTDGRCITSGTDGRLLVWDLDQDAMLRPLDEEGEGNTAGDYVGWREKAELEYVEVRTGGARLARAGKQAGMALDKRKGKGRETLDIASTAPMRALRQSILPVPPIAHPLSLVSAAEELRASPNSRARTPRTSQEVEDDGNMHDAERRAGVRGLVFNEEMIVGIVPSVSTSKRDSVRIWKFDV